MSKEEVNDKIAIFECLVKTPVAFTTPSHLEPCGADYSPFVDIEKVDQKNVLKMLCYARFNSDNPLPIRKNPVEQIKFGSDHFSKTFAVVYAPTTPNI